MGLLCGGWLSEMKKTGISSAVIDWFSGHGRDLPWRQTREPYKIWLSEVILQQTRVQQGMAYYHRFTEKYPTLNHLAEAEEEDVLGLWQGLGYYSRGRNLLATARFIVANFNGKFPETYQELIRLKGIGPYTAAAIASFAFGEEVAAVDGNVIRVICRLFAWEEDIRKTSVQNQVKEMADSLLPEGKAWEYNQAMMELGATICTPSNPDCPRCPVNFACLAFRKGLQKKIPFKSKSAARRIRYFNYLLTESCGAFAFRRREGEDIWKGLFEPLLIESDHVFQYPEEFFIHLPGRSALVHKTRMFPPQKCLLSHQEIIVSLCLCQIDKKDHPDGFRWVSGQELPGLPKPVIFSKILQKLNSGSLYLDF